MLRLNKQLCFPIYALAKEIVALYRPLLEAIDLTYPQYLVMLILWEHGPQSVTQLGKRLELDSGTLTPLLKRLEQKNRVYRKRNQADERSVVISLTEAGAQLRDLAAPIPAKLAETLSLSPEEIMQLKNLLQKIRNGRSKL